MPKAKTATRKTKKDSGKKKKGEPFADKLK